MRFDLTDLRLFVAVVRRGSITHGAEAMNLALASASQRVSGMETTLGVIPIGLSSDFFVMSGVG